MDVLVDDFGWTHDDWVDWTVATLKEQIFSGPARHTATARAVAASATDPV
jgi:hypothetical protein